MFTSGIERNQRCNGILSSSSECIGKPKSYSQTKIIKTVANNHVLYNNINKFSETANKTSKYTDSFSTVKVKVEPPSFDNNITASSIIGLGKDSDRMQKAPTNSKPRIKWNSIRATHHETLERIESLEDFYNHYQQHWFSASIEKFKLEDRSREERIEITRHEFMRYLQQIIRSNVGKFNKNQESYESRNSETNNLIKNETSPTPSTSKSSHRNIVNGKGYNKLIATKTCDIENCSQPALPCTKHCTLHIMYNRDQILFGYCTAKFADNTQCSVPVFDITHELPLCPEHARKRDNYKLYQEAKPKKLRKKVKPSAMIRPQKRNKKKKRPSKCITDTTTTSAILDLPLTNVVKTAVESSPDELEEDIHMVDQVLGLNESDGLEQVLETQASHLLEETDITNVLSTIQVDEFSDFFTVNRNGDYEPTREETEELEKALAAVDNDVKSLEKLSQSQGLLDSLLDEHALAESLVQIPDVFHNGYTQCGDNMVSQTSFLLPVEQQSHS